MREIEGVSYINCGDWMESATAVAETDDGTFEIIRYMDIIEAERNRAAAMSTTAAAA
jgi:hypothetical protein